MCRPCRLQFSTPSRSGHCQCGISPCYPIDQTVIALCPGFRGGRSGVNPRDPRHQTGVLATRHAASLKYSHKRANNLHQTCVLATRHAASLKHSHGRSRNLAQTGVLATPHAASLKHSHRRSRNWAQTGVMATRDAASLKHSHGRSRNWAQTGVLATRDAASLTHSHGRARILRTVQAKTPGALGEPAPLPGRRRSRRG